MRKVYTLQEMQRLPHKWWKKGVDYIPAVKDYYIGKFYLIPMFKTPKIDSALEAIFSIPLYVHKQPNLYDYLYALNTELLEYQEALIENDVSQVCSEMADIAIFAGLCLRYKYGYTLKQLEEDIRTRAYFVLVKGLRSTDPNLIYKLKYLLLWGWSGGRVIEKIEFNKERVDHDRSIGH